MANKKDLTIFTGSPLSRLMDFRRFDDMFRAFDDAFKHWDLDMKTFTEMQPKGSFPKMNVSETDEAIEVEIALAGFDKEDLTLELKDNCLCVKADKKEEVSDNGKNYIMKEISSRSFRRALNLPTKVKVDDIKCTHKDGIITCVLQKDVPQLAEDEPIKIDIQ